MRLTKIDDYVYNLEHILKIYQQTHINILSASAV